ADEQAVALFLSGHLRLTDIPEAIEAVLARHVVIDDPDIAAIIAASAWAQDEVSRWRATHAPAHAPRSDRAPESERTHLPATDTRERP
ncbi:MAG TPA: hypothetical protein VGN32_20820, partial [Ktedonobacterales bacterium]|nr:hypothetical protein [Ktedonobacterales bacterium]